MSRHPRNPGTSLLGNAVRAMQSGKVAVAIKHARRHVRQRPDDPAGLHMLGVMLFQHGKVGEAADHIGRAIAAGASEASHFADWGLALKAAGRLEEARAAYEQAVVRDPTAAGVWNDRGTTLMRLGQFRTAEDSFRQSLKLNAQDARTHVNLGAVLLAMGKPEAAIEANRQAIALNPELAPGFNGLGSALSRTGDVTGAVEAFEQAIALDATHVEALGNLASLYEETSRLDEARRTAGQVLATIPSFTPPPPRKNSGKAGSAGEPEHKAEARAHAELVLAKCDRREAEFQTGIDRLSALDLDKLPQALARDVAFEQSRLHDRLGNAANACEAMVRGNVAARRCEGVDENAGDRFLDHVASLRGWQTPKATMSAGKDDFRDPVFLMGFPRSGTTLLGQILDAHSDLHLIEERPMLDAVIARIRTELGDYPAVLSEDQRRGFRSLYFEQAAMESPDTGARRIVDKFPLHLINTGLIHTLFPDSRIILAIRHPCDVVLSCFMQNFRPNPAMANFYSLERGARAYDRVLDLWTHLETTVQPDFHRVRYEDMIEDFRAGVGGMLDYLGLPWQDSVLDYASRARKRGRIDTPSYHQVTEPIYSRARYRWLRYKAELEPVMETLQPWITALGYDRVE